MASPGWWLWSRAWFSVLTTLAVVFALAAPAVMLGSSPAQAYTSTGTVPADCPDGYYVSLVQQQCVAAPAGYYVPPTGGYNIPNPTAAVPCPAGTFSPTIASSSCFTDPVDSYSTAGSPQPMICSAGTYTALIRQASCPPVTSGHFVPQAGMTPFSCPAGSATSSDGTTCLISNPANNCSSGQYYSSGSCMNCPAGEFQPLVGQTFCYQAPPGFYGTTVAANSVLVCSAGTYNTGYATTSVNDCLPVPAGTFSPLPAQPALTAAINDASNQVSASRAASPSICPAGELPAPDHTACQTLPGVFAPYGAMSVGAACPAPYISYPLTCSDTSNNTVQFVAAADAIGTQYGTAPTTEPIYIDGTTPAPFTSAPTCTVSGFSGDGPGYYVGATTCSGGTSYWPGPIVFQAGTLFVNGPVAAADGTGSVGISPTTVTAASTGNTLVFTYTGGPTVKGSLTIAVPSDWSAPSTTATEPGYTTSTCGSVAVSAGTITVSEVTQAASASQCTVTYGDRTGSGPGATASDSALASFAVSEASTPAGTLTALSDSPVPLTVQCGPGSLPGANSACIYVPAGDYLTSGGTPSPCPAGTYQPAAGQTSCLTAQPGYYAATAGATGQTACPAGATSTAGATACTPIGGSLSATGALTYSTSGPVKGTLSINPATGAITSVAGTVTMPGAAGGTATVNVAVAQVFGVYIGVITLSDPGARVSTVALIYATTLSRTSVGVQGTATGLVGRKTYTLSFNI